MTWVEEIKRENAARREDIRLGRLPVYSPSPEAIIDRLVFEVERLQEQVATLKRESDAGRKREREIWAVVHCIREGDPETGQCRPGGGD